MLGAGQGRITFVRTSADGAAPPARWTTTACVVEPDGADTLLVHEASPELVGAIAAEHGVPLVELRPHARSLEDAFLELTGSSQ